MHIFSFRKYLVWLIAAFSESNFGKVYIIEMCSLLS